MTRPRSARPLLLQSFERWNRFTADQMTMWLGAGEVIGRRTTAMARHGMAPDALERREMARMIEEKQAAMLEGSLAAWNEWMRLAQASWLQTIGLAMGRGFALDPVALDPLMAATPLQAIARTQAYARAATTRSMTSAARQWHAPLDTQLRIANAALRPMRERVAANRKRLAA